MKKSKLRKLIREIIKEQQYYPGKPTTTLSHTVHIFEGCRCGPATNINTGPSNNLNDSIVVQAVGPMWSNTEGGEPVDPFLNDQGFNLFNFSYQSYMDEQGLDWNYDPSITINSATWQLDNPDNGEYYDTAENSVDNILAVNDLINDMWGIEGSQAVKLLTCGAISDTCKPSCVTKVGTAPIPAGTPLEQVGNISGTNTQVVELNGHNVKIYGYAGSIRPKFDSPYDNCQACCDENPTTQSGYECRPSHISGTSKCVPCLGTSSSPCLFETEQECINSGCEEQQNDLTFKKEPIDTQTSIPDPIDTQTLSPKDTQTPDSIDTVTMLQRRAGIKP